MKNRLNCVGFGFRFTILEVVQNEIGHPSDCVPVLYGNIACNSGTLAQPSGNFTIAHPVLRKTSYQADCSREVVCLLEESRPVSLAFDCGFGSNSTKTKDSFPLTGLPEGFSSACLLEIDIRSSVYLQTRHAYGLLFRECNSFEFDSLLKGCNRMASLVNRDRLFWGSHGRSIRA